MPDTPVCRGVHCTRVSSAMAGAVRARGPAAQRAADCDICSHGQRALCGGLYSKPPVTHRLRFSRGLVHRRASVSFDGASTPRFHGPCIRTSALLETSECGFTFTDRAAWFCWHRVCNRMRPSSASRSFRSPSTSSRPGRRFGGATHGRLRVLQGNCFQTCRTGVGAQLMSSPAREFARRRERSHCPERSRALKPTNRTVFSILHICSLCSPRVTHSK